jgi:hypothetical protein
VSSETFIRVLAAIDYSSPSREVLQQLPRLLGSESIEITGLFIEDEDLLRAANLPGLREVSLSGQEIELDIERVRRQTAEEIDRMRRAFGTVARGLRMRHRFEIARGRLAESLCRAAEQSDFVLITRSVRASGLRARRGLQFRELLDQPKDVLFVNEPWASGRSIVVLDGDAEALRVGTRLTEVEGLELVVALPEAAPTPEWLADDCRIVRVRDWSEDTIADLCLAADARLLILPAQQPLQWSELLMHLMDRLPCSLLKLG